MLSQEAMQVGIFTHYFRYNVRETARRIRQLGFATVQLVPSFPEFVQAGKSPAARFDHVREVFDEEGLSIAAISGYVNLVAPDPDRRREGRDQLHALLR